MRKAGVQILTVGLRLREERLRLGLSQERFATIAGVAKNTAINWEKDASSPTAAALISWIDAGADALYILTGRRAAENSDAAVATIAGNISEIRRDLLVQEWEGGADGEAHLLKLRTRQLNDLKVDSVVQAHPDLLEEVESLSAIVASPVQLAAFRAADHVQRRAQRKEMREKIRAWTDLGTYHPSEELMSLMTAIALDYNVPIGTLVELVYEIVASDEPISARTTP